MSRTNCSERAEALKDAIRLSSIVGERVRLKRRGHWHDGCCPFHDDGTPSFWVNDEIGRYGCHGCEAAGDVIQFVMDTELVSFAEALDRLEGGYSPARHAREPSRSGNDNTRNVERARKIWTAAGPIEGTPAENYLAKRALRLGELPTLNCLRYARLSYDGSAELFPTLIAAITTPYGDFAGIQRTYLTEDGDKLDPHSAKRSLGNLKGNAIRIREDSGEMLRQPTGVLLCEGLEDGLTLARMQSESGFCEGDIYVAAGAGMMRSVELPKSCRTLSIVADNDAAGARAAKEAATLFEKRGLHVFIMEPHWLFKDINEQHQALDAGYVQPEDLGWAR